ncbi:MAG: hypothetical protein NTV44_04740 [Firmicutes bacterium]|nr:hypothetical protein [Bacillota bacterium]
MQFTRWMEQQPLVIKVILALPFLDFIWGIYRLVKAINSKSDEAVIIAIVLLLISGYIWWLVDLIALIMNGKILFVKE